MSPIDLSFTRCRFTCTGPDAQRYLNGQVTQDIRGVTPRQAMPACLTNAKGKLEAELVIAAMPGGYLIDAPAALRDMLGPRLEKYLIADDCQILDVTDDTAQFHFPADPATQLPTDIPTDCHEITRWGQPGWERLLPVNQADALRAQATTESGPGSAWDDARIRRGIPIWGAELDAATLPPEAGLEATHISYTKGCYIGQEVISRLRSVGQVARKLCLLESTTGESIGTGWALHASPAPDDAARPLGTLTSATSDGQCALAFLRRPHHLAGSIVYALPNDGSSRSIALEIRPIPSHIPSPPVDSRP